MNTSGQNSHRTECRTVSRAVTRLISAVAVVAAMCAAAGEAHAALATYQFGSGPITFGMALPQGAATGVQIGSLPTQADVKTRWPDGSIRFAVVSAEIPTQGTYELNAAAPAQGAFSPAWPSITLDLVINNVTWTASPGAFTTADLWLSGPVVREARVKVAPQNAGTSHPLLEVIFDIRSYAGGAHRVDVTVQNVRDSVSMDKVPVSSVALRVNGGAIWTHGAVTSYSMTRWRHVEWVGGREAAIVPDFEPMFQAGVLPRFLSSVANKTYDLSGPNYGLMGGPPPGGYPAIAYGEMNPDMAAGGGRAEIGPIDWWEAVYLVHRTANQRATVLRNADLTGAWSNHLAKPDGTTIRLGDAGYDPAYWWWDTRAAGNNRPLAPINAAGNFRGAREGLSPDTDTGAANVASRYNEEHVPAPMFVAYVISGDRYYVDQAKYWSTRAILQSAPMWLESDPVNFPGWKRGRNGATGNERILDFSGMTREFGWPLRLLGVTSWMIPDADSDKGYFLETVQNNLNHVGSYLDTWVRLGYGGAIGAIGGAESGNGWGWRRNGQETGRYTSQWRLAYTTYTVDWCTRQGLWSISASVDEFVNRVVRLDVAMNLQNPAFLSGQSGLSYNYYPVFNTMASGRFDRWFNTFAEVKSFNETYQYTDGAPGNPNWNPRAPAVGYYNVDHHLMLQIGVRKGVANAQAAADRLAQVPGHAGDLNHRAGFALVFSAADAGGATSPPLTGTPPARPNNVRLIP
jgi:hypothetical protein